MIAKGNNPALCNPGTVRDINFLSNGKNALELLHEVCFPLGDESIVKGFENLSLEA